MPIEQYQAGPLSNASDARLIYRGSADDREAFEFQVTPHDIGDIQLIFDNQNISIHPAAPRRKARARSWSRGLHRPTHLGGTSLVSSERFCACDGGRNVVQQKL